VTGDCIAAVGRRVLREETFVRILEPAVADLQFEAPRQSGLRRLASYAAVSVVLIRAIFYDLLDDLALAFGGEARRHAWAPAIVCYGSLFVLLLWRQLSAGIVVDFYGTVTRLPLPPAGDGLELYLAGVVARVGLVCVSYAMVAAVFTFRRKNIGTARTALAAVLLVAIATFTVARMSRSARHSADLMSSAIVLRGDTDPRTVKPLADVVASEVIPGRKVGVLGNVTIESLDGRSHAWEEIGMGLNVAVFALLGVALARSRGWRLGARAAAMVATGSVFNRWAVPVVDLIVVPLGNKDPALHALPGFLVVPFVACVFLAVRPRTRRAA
jgi:hypothetical protein